MKTTILSTLLVAWFTASGQSVGQTLRSAAEPDYPPFSIVKADGSADGLAVELLKAALSEMGLEATFKTAPWDQIKAELAEGQLDVLPLVGRTPEREGLYDFTIPYLTLHGALFVRTDETGIASLNDLAGKRIAVMAGDNAEEYVRRSKLSENIIGTPTFEQAFRMLSTGEADAVIAQKLMGVSLLKTLGLQNIRVVGKPNQEFKQDFCFAVKKGNAGLLATLNEGLAVVMANGTQRRLMNKWIGSGTMDTARARVLIYGDDFAFPPYSFLDEKGEPAGFNVELLRAIAKETGIEISFQLKVWSEVLREAKAGEIDITSMLYDQNRSQLVDYSLPHSAMYWTVFARDDSPAYHSIGDLKDFPVSVQCGDVLHEYALAQNLGAPLSVTMTFEEALRQLAAGKVDFALGYNLPGFYRINRNNWDNLRVVEPRLLRKDYCFVVQKDHAELLDLLNSGLMQLHENGEYRKLYNKWMGPLESSTNWAAVWKYLLTGAAVLLVLGTVTSLWIFLLRRQVRKKTAELSRIGERFELATEAGGIGVWDRDIVNDGLIWDKRMHELYGIRAEDFNGSHDAWARSLHPEDLERAAAEVAAAERGEKPFGTTFRIIRPNGEIRHIRAFGKVIRDGSGKPVRMIGTNQDITERMEARQRLKASEEKLRNIIEHSTNMFYSRSCDHVLTYVSPQVKEILGYEVAEMLIRWTELATDHPENGRGLHLTQEAIRTGEAQPTYELQLKHKKGHPVWVEVREAPVVENGTTVAIVGSLTDITQRRLAEENLRARNKELERFNKASVGRELRMIELKKEVNALCLKVGTTEPYPLQSTGSDDGGMPDAMA